MKRLLLLFLLCFGLVLPGVAADGTSFNPTTISVKSVGASIPVGTVITWPSNSWPSDRDNWLECNGQSISSAVYPELVGVVGSRVPDYRGIFLRGQGSQTSTHYGTVTHSSAALGQLQGDGIRTIWGTFVGGDWSGHNNQGGSSGAFWPSGNAGVQEGNRYDQIRYSFDVSRVTPVVGEVRPVNRAVRYLIRAR
ncbi:phage tail protein [Bilophila wadsworthia]